MSTRSAENLGQVFTVSHVAKIMVQLLRNNLSTGLVLDPGIGPNSFFKYLKEIEYVKIGVDVDPTILRQKIDKNVHYIYGNFFDLTPSRKFDGIIMNPPYVRQEELSTSTLNNKSKLHSKLVEYKKYLDKRHNLYVYFVMKAHQLLKEEGTLILICYDSWIYTQYGIKFMKFINDMFNVRSIIHFEKKAFKNAEIGATIMELKKTTPINTNTLYKKYNDYNSYDNNESGIEVNLTDLSQVTGMSLIDYSEPLFIQMKDLVERKIRRGIDPLSSKHFVLKNKKIKEMIPIIKNVKSISTYSISLNDIDYLVYSKSIENTEEYNAYMNRVKQDILISTRNKTMKKKINQGSNWNEIKIVDPGLIIFNYYLRGRVRFLYNPMLYYISHNFYILTPKYNSYLMMAILNSTITKMTILSHARTQGNGLRKIQLYEFRKVPIINPNLINSVEKKKLESLGKSLISSSKESENEIIRDIDTILIKVYNKKRKEPINEEMLEKYIRFI